LLVSFSCWDNDIVVNWCAINLHKSAVWQWFVSDWKVLLKCQISRIIMISDFSFPSSPTNSVLFDEKVNVPRRIVLIIHVFEQLAMINIINEFYTTCNNFLWKQSVNGAYYASN
jgi:hypothetical protein